MNKEALSWAIVILVFVSSSAEADKFITSENGQRFYVEIELELNWFEAVDKCLEMNMTLISMDSAKKTLDFYLLYRKNFVNTHINREFWIGGHDHNVSRRFEWISSGEVFGYTNWASGQPNDVTHRCEMFTGYSLEWYDCDCNSKYGFVCEEMSMRMVTNKLVLLKASLDNQRTQLNEKTEQFDSLQNDFEKFKRESREKQTNLKLEFNEQMKVFRHELEDTKQKQEEFVMLQNSLEQQNKTELKKKTKELVALKKEFEKHKNTTEIHTNLKLEFDELTKLQIQGLEEIKQIQEELVKFQKSSEQQMVQLNQTQIEWNTLKAQISNENESEAIKSTVNQDISNPIYCATQATLLKAKSEELDKANEALKKANEMIKHQFNVLMKIYELNTYRATPNKNYNIFPNLNKN